MLKLGRERMFVSARTSLVLDVLRTIGLIGMGEEV